MNCRLAAGLAAAALAAVRLPAIAAPTVVPSGAIYVSTLPTGADVWVDGSYVGRSPVLVGALALGRHGVTLEKAGLPPREVAVDVPRADVVMSSVLLEAPAAPARACGSASAPPRPPAGSGAVAVRRAPPGALVAIDGAPFVPGPDRALPLAAGAHRVAMTTPRGRSERAFRVVEGTTTELVLREPEAGAPPSAVLAPADDYLPTDDYTVERSKVLVRHAGHVVVARFGESSFRVDGKPATYAGEPEMIRGRLYLPLDLLERLTGDTSQTR